MKNLPASCPLFFWLAVLGSCSSRPAGGRYHDQAPPPAQPPRCRLWRALLGLALLLLAGRAQSQATQQPWAGVVTPSAQPYGYSYAQAVATDASGNVFVTGNFTGQVAFGNTVLTSQGNRDLFVAKYVPGSSTWAWAQRGGGGGDDQGNGIAVSGTSVYVTGYITSNTANSYGVVFGGAGATQPQYGATASTSIDLVVAKYTDNGSTATLGWTQVGGGYGDDRGTGIAVSGPNVYVTGSIYNNTSNATQVMFGGAGAMVGIVPQYGTNAYTYHDLVVAKYTDHGSTATLGWTQVGGGYDDDRGKGIAVSGPNVYVTGYITNDTANSYGVMFGGTGATPGTVPQSGVAAPNNTGIDLVVVKYIDNGSTATVAWTQVGGGGSGDKGYGIAVSGPSVYVTGSIFNNTANSYGVVFGNGSPTAGATPSPNGSDDLVVVKYIDNGSTATLGWTQVGGGTNYDQGTSVAVSGTSVYVTGSIFNNTSNASQVVFGGGGTTLGTASQPGATAINTPNIVVAKYTDNGPAATLGWTQVGGGGGAFDQGTGIAVRGANVYVAGGVVPVAIFGTYSISSPTGGNSTMVLALLTDAPVLATLHPSTGPAALAAVLLYPNPARGLVTVVLPGLPGTSTVQAEVFNALGQLVSRQQAALPATGTTLTLPTRELASGVYVVHLTAGGAEVTRRLTVE